MFLEIFTLLLLAAVLIVKYASTVHTVKLQQKLAEATNLAQRNQERYKRLQQERQAEEAQTVNQKRQIDEHLEGLQNELKEQEHKNSELAERIEKVK